MRRLWRPMMLTALALAGCLSVAGTRDGGSASAPAQRILREARRILANSQTTVYSHRTKIDEDDGRYEVDCSGLVRYVLRRASPRHLDAIAAGGRKTPRAVDFYEFFKARRSAETGRTGWAAVERVIDARPGDVIAWRRERIEPGRSTGHVMILAEPPVAEGDDVVRVVVIDSTTVGPGSDRREVTSGVGLSVVRFRVDRSGAPVAYRGPWNSTYRQAPIAIGRAVEFASP